MPYDEMLFNMAYFANESTAASAENENAMKDKQAVLAYLATLVVYDENNEEHEQRELRPKSAENDVQIITLTDESFSPGVMNDEGNFRTRSEANDSAKSHGDAEAGVHEPQNPPFRPSKEHKGTSGPGTPRDGKGVDRTHSTASATESREEHTCPVCAESLIPPPRRRRRRNRYRSRRSSRCAVGNAPAAFPDDGSGGSQSTGSGSFDASSSGDAYGELDTVDTWATRSFDAGVAALQQQEQKRKKWPGVVTLPACKHSFHGKRESEKTSHFVPFKAEAHLNSATGCTLNAF